MKIKTVKSDITLAFAKEFLDIKYKMSTLS